MSDIPEVRLARSRSVATWSWTVVAFGALLGFLVNGPVGALIGAGVTAAGRHLLLRARPDSAS